MDYMTHILCVRQTETERPTATERDRETERNIRTDRQTDGFFDAHTLHFQANLYV